MRYRRPFVVYEYCPHEKGGVIFLLLANLVGDIIDKELEKAGYKFVY